MPTRRMRLTVDVVVDDDGVLHGRVGCDGESPSDFTGWLGLLSGLDQLLAAPSRDNGAGGRDVNTRP